MTSPRPADHSALDRQDSPRPASAWTAPLAVAALVLLTALVFYQALAGGVFVDSDFSQVFEPQRSALRQGIEARDTPPGGSLLWTSRFGNGSPVLANPLHAALYPPNILFRLATRSSVARLLTLLALAHILWGAIGAWFLARLWRIEPAGAWVTAVVFGFCGLSVSAIASLAIAWTTAWLPWLVLAGERLRLAPRGRVVAALFLAFVLAMMILAGEPFVILAGVGLLAILQCEGGEEERGSRRRRLGALLGGVAGGVVLASPALAATLRYLPASVRAAGFQDEGILQWSLHPLEILGFLVPGAFGDPTLRGLPGFWGKALVPGRDHELFAGLYLGGLVIALAAAGAIRSRRRERLLQLWTGILLLLALGRYGPFYHILVRLPGGDALRHPVKWLAPAMLGVALMAGRGVGVFTAAPASGERRLSTAVVSITLAVLAIAALVASAATAGLDRVFAGLALLPPQYAHEIDPLTRLVRTALVQGSTRSALPLLGLFAALALRARAKWGGRPRAAAVLGWVAAVLVTADLAQANPRLAPVAPESFYRVVPAAARAVLDDPEGHNRLYIEEPWSVDDVFVDPPLTAIDFFQWQRQTLQVYAAASYSIDLAFNIDIEVFTTLHYARLGYLLDKAPLREKLMLLGAAGATHLATHRPLSDARLRAVAVQPGRMERPLRVFRNLLAVPRARVVPAATVYRDNAGFIEAVRRGPDDLFFRTTLIEQADAIPAASPGPAAVEAEPGSPAGARTAIIHRDTGSELAIHVTGAGGYLVLNDALVPGWSATVDGRAAPIIRADYAFRAVPVPAGDHDVMMRYFPWSQR